MSSLSPILNNLDADDLAVRLFAILRLQDLTGNDVIPEKLRQAAKSETDPALKLYLSWLAYPEKSAGFVSSDTLSSMLNQKQPDWPTILRILLQTSRQSATPALALLRKTPIKTLSPGLLPVLVGFYSRFGESQDVAQLEVWCSHSNPAVTILAVEGLSRIQPESLRSRLYPLLTSESAGIKSQAIRLLYRWHPEEALAQLEIMLESTIIDERRAALAHAFFLPFDQIKNNLIRFMTRESEPVLLLQVGQLLIINPDLETIKAVAKVIVTTTPEKEPIITDILMQQCDFASRAKLVQDSPEELAERMLTEAAATADKTRCDSISEVVYSEQIDQSGTIKFEPTYASKADIEDTAQHQSGLQKIQARLMHLPTGTQITLSAIVIVFLSLLLLINQPAINDFAKPASNASITKANKGSASRRNIHRFEHWQQPAETGQKRKAEKRGE